MSPKTGHVVLPGNTCGIDNEDPLPSAFTSSDVTGANDHVDKSTTEYVKEAYKQITIVIFHTIPHP